MTQLLQKLPVPGVDVPHRMCPKCGQPQTIKRIAIPEGTKRKGWKWICVPCTNKQARVTHQSPHRQAAKDAYRAKHAEKIACRKGEWQKEDRALHPAKYKEQAKRSHDQLMNDPERKRAKYDKANERDRVALVELKKDSVAYEAELERDRARCRDKYKRLHGRILDQSKASHYKNKYGISLEQLDALWTAQSGKCLICSTDLPNPAKTKKKHARGVWHLDHCHQTGEIRGILCHRCNMALGMMKDDTLRLQKAIDYLNGGNRSLVSAVLNVADEESAPCRISNTNADAAVGLHGEWAKA
jgi:hypothetical protein